jgi:hypothetical protein
MSPYEILAVAALAAAGGFAYWLYRSDTKPGAPKPPAGESGSLMFGRDRDKH